MIKKKTIKKYIRQIIALSEKNVALELRIKANFISRFLNPLIQLFLFFFIFGAIFNINPDFNFGYWNSTNYLSFLCLAFSVQFSRSIINQYKQLFITEKYWKTLSGLLIAPMNRNILLFGVLFSEFIINGIPMALLILLAWIFTPISFIFIILVIMIYISIFLIFGGIGLLVGVFAISHESYAHYSQIVLRLLLFIS